ncbi:MAG: hypothetical protein A2Z88_06265 [Omnitrophica WOR_2 bacterium GWA2_47_8]|nr:MAG: hypothetical protein A2Z88_06265 [Omnitrophica WOR_2 bacterium GWA2_47_8]
MVFFYIVWFFFLIGLFSQVSCILMTLCCYYFYALNAFHIGTLSWDILLVTLFLMCVTPYHGDYFSVDCLRQGDLKAYRKERPFFLQRLLQMQIAFTFFYTGLYKISSQGNWLWDNPIYYLMNYPPEGVTKLFLLRDFFASRPVWCYWTGVLIVVVELLMPILLFNRKTRMSAIYLGIFFHIVLILTLDVPAIFFFLFPAQLLLFVNPENVVKWVEQKRAFNQNERQSKLIHDGHCGFCRGQIKLLAVMDLFATLKMVDFHSAEDLRGLHKDLTLKKATSQIHLIEPDGTLYGGFDVFKRICLHMPMLYPLILVFYFPGMGVIGPHLYRWVAKNRYLFHVNKVCRANACFR